MHLAHPTGLCRPRSRPNISHAMRWSETATSTRRAHPAPTKDNIRRGKSMSEAQRASGSGGRWYILLLISLMYLITYLDRVNISTVAPVISKEFGFDKVTMGIIFSAFVWAYALFQVPGGLLNDRFGPRRVLAMIVAYWSVMTAATATATGAVSFVIVPGNAPPSPIPNRKRSRR